MSAFPSCSYSNPTATSQPHRRPPAVLGVQEPTQGRVGNLAPRRKGPGGALRRGLCVISPFGFPSNRQQAPQSQCRTSIVVGGSLKSDGAASFDLRIIKPFSAVAGTVRIASPSTTSAFSTFAFSASGLPGCFNASRSLVLSICIFSRPFYSLAMILHFPGVNVGPVTIAPPRSDGTPGFDMR